MKKIIWFLFVCSAVTVSAQQSKEQLIPELTYSSAVKKVLDNTSFGRLGSVTKKDFPIGTIFFSGTQLSKEKALTTWRYLFTGTKLINNGINVIVADDGFAVVEYRRKGLFSRREWWLSYVSEKKMRKLSQKLKVRLFDPEIIAIEKAKAF